ncbi:hypothetical protein AL755_09510 [Arthrobacter sp. ERGS1:01]|nr:hypothetical protein AL755_09510 [Arthrobacter sp. ERGS1:01]
MAMNQRPPKDSVGELEKLVLEEHTSNSALLLQWPEMVLQSHCSRGEIVAVWDTPSDVGTVMVLPSSARSWPDSRAMRNFRDTLAESANAWWVGP